MKPLVFILLTDTFFKLRIVIQTLQRKGEELLNVIKQ